MMACLASFAHASTILHGSASPVSAGLSLIYDPGTGHLTVDAPNGIKLSAFQLESTGSHLTGQCEHMGGPFDVCTNSKVFKLVTDGFETLDLGPVLQPDLRPNDLLDDLTIDGATLPSGFHVGTGAYLVHPAFVPEPGSGALLLAAGWLLLWRHRRGA
jgi:hypothetical protein